MSLVSDPVVDALSGRDFRLLVGGKLVGAADGATMAILNPSTGETLTSVPSAGSEDVDLCWRAAQSAQRSWEALGIDGRIEAVRTFARLVEANAAALARLDAVSGGLAFQGALEDVHEAVASLHQWTSLVRWHGGRTIPASRGNLHYTTFRPYGVVGRILAFNHPALFAICGGIPALLAGNSVLLKSAPQAPLSALALGELARDVFPPGVLNILSGGAEAGQAIVSHPKIKRVAFTGSVATGQRILAQAAAVGVKHVSLELGGKNAMIVFPDGGLDAAVDGAIRGMNFGVCAGQSCGSNSRTYIHEDIYEPFIARVAERLDAMRIGPAYADEVDMGPLISKAQLDRVSHYVHSGVEEGARLLTREGTFDDGGYFARPALLADVTPTMRVAREEVFGPVMAMAPWRDKDEVIALANDSDYGLTASVWTTDLDSAHLVADRLEAGYVWINQTAEHYFGVPFGGHKNSGLGREECVEEYESYLELKSVHVVLNHGRS